MASGWGSKFSSEALHGEDALLHVHVQLRCLQVHQARVHLAEPELGGVPEDQILGLHQDGVPTFGGHLGVTFARGQRSTNFSLDDPELKG